MIAVAVGVIVFGLGLIGAEGIETFISNFRSMAINNGLPPVITDLIAEPLIFAFSGEPLGALIAGVLWPLGAAWVALFVLMIVFGLLATAWNTVT